MSIERIRTHGLALAATAALALTGCEQSGESPHETPGAEEPANAESAAGATGQGSASADQQRERGTEPARGGAPPAEGTAPAGGGAPPAEGTAPAGGGSQPSMGGAGEPVSDEDLDAFAEAYIEVEDVQKSLESKLQAAESNEEAQQIQQSAMSEMREAVESTGMKFQTYGRIAQQLQQDPELMKRVEETIESKRDES